MPCLPGLVPALLLAMDDVGADRLSQRALSLLDALASCTPIAAFMAAVWGCLLHNSAVRLQALHYITTRFPTPGADADDGSGGLGETSKGVATTSSARLAVPPSFSVPTPRAPSSAPWWWRCSAETRSVRRTALELLVNHFPLPAPEGAASAAHAAAAAAAGGDDGDDPAADPAAAAAAALFDASGESPIKSGLAAADVLFGRGGGGNLWRAERRARRRRRRRRRRRLGRSLAPRASTALLAAALRLLPQREWALTRRIVLWLLGRRRRRRAPRPSCRCRRTRAASSSPPLPASSTALPAAACFDAWSWLDAPSPFDNDGASPEGLRAAAAAEARARAPSSVPPPAMRGTRRRAPARSKR